MAVLCCRWREPFLFIKCYCSKSVKKSNVPDTWFLMRIIGCLWNVSFFIRHALGLLCVFFKYVSIHLLSSTRNGRFCQKKYIAYMALFIYDFVFQNTFCKEMQQLIVHIQYHEECLYNCYYLCSYVIIPWDEVWIDDIWVKLCIWDETPYISNYMHA